GYFPCAPKAPSVAFDINMLELMAALFLRVAPNITAWASTLEAFLGARQFKLRTRHSVRRRLGNALNWYTYLTDHVQAEINSVINLARTKILTTNLSSEHRGPESSSDAQTKSADCQAPESVSSNQPPRSSKHTFSAGSHAEAGRASAYLRSRCPLCFGGTGQHDKSVG
ncbi:hypothetical protein PUNSTDRAFT_77692, partial [Punctularia strigosozonata HHB-11173 SS5]